MDLATLLEHGVSLPLVAWLVFEVRLLRAEFKAAAAVQRELVRGHLSEAAHEELPRNLVEVCKHAG